MKSARLRNNIFRQFHAGLSLDCISRFAETKPFELFGLTKFYVLFTELKLFIQLDWDYTRKYIIYENCSVSSSKCQVQYVHSLLEKAVVEEFKWSGKNRTAV